MNVSENPDLTDKQRHEKNPNEEKRLLGIEAASAATPVGIQKGLNPPVSQNMWAEVHLHC